MLQNWCGILFISNYYHVSSNVYTSLLLNGRKPLVVSQPVGIGHLCFFNGG